MATINAINALNITFGDKTITTNTGALVIPNGIQTTYPAASLISNLTVAGGLTMGNNSVNDCASYGFNTVESTNYLTLMGSATGSSGSGANGLWVAGGAGVGNIYDTIFNPLPKDVVPSYIPYPTGSVDPIVFGKAYLATDPDDIGTTVFTMPTDGVTPGQVLMIAGSGISQWTLTITTGQAIFMDDVLISDGGALSSITPRSSVTLVCTAFSPGNQVFSVVNSFGQLDLS